MQTAGNPLTGGPDARDAVLLLSGEALSVRADACTNIVCDRHRLTLAPGALWGEWVSQPMRAGFAFVELLASCSAACPPGSWLRFYVRAESASGDWSPWLPLGQWGCAPPWSRGLRGPAPPWHLDIDIVRCEQACVSARLRLVLGRARRGLAAPAISAVAATVSDPCGDYADPPSSCAPVAPVDLRVPFLSQHAVGGPLARELCSPTSLAMVLAYYGITAEPLRVAERVYDADYQIFGNWTYNVRAAAEWGVCGYLARFRRWEQVEATLTAGVPIVASIRFDAHKLMAPPYSATNGHLLVVRGLAADGDVITNDPNLCDAAAGCGLVWRSDDFARAWFARGGVGYVLFAPGETARVLG